MIHGGPPGAMPTDGSVAREGDALKWLFSFADFERGTSSPSATGRPGAWDLGRTRALLDEAGAPDRRLRCVLIAGTKGKGSTAAFLASLLHAAGIHAGLYTQPHLQLYSERIRIDGAIIDPADLAQGVDRLQPAVRLLRERGPDTGDPTTFELMTVLALERFATAGCAVAVLEVGLGGRLDATNAVEPEISVITSIGYDHTELLGRELGSIAREKAGILRAGRPAYLAVQRPSAGRALRSACRDVGALCEVVDPLPAGTRLPLPGAMQLQNAALAVAVARHLGATGDNVIARGLAALRWPGRFEVVYGEPPVALDGAHNDSSAEALAATLSSRFGRQGYTLIVGMFRDKNARAVLGPLLPRARRVLVTSPRGARARPAEEVAKLCRRLTRVPVEVHETVAAALERARSVRDGGPICVTGSLALVGEARDALGLPPVERLWEA